MSCSGSPLPEMSQNRPLGKIRYFGCPVLPIGNPFLNVQLLQENYKYSRVHTFVRRKCRIRRTAEGDQTVESERVTIRLPDERIQALQALVDQGKFSTISDAIRAAIDKFVEGEFTPEYIEKITVELPKGNVVNLKQLVQEGDSVSVDDAIRNAVREYIRKRVSKAMEELER
jgi:Arc/MetJ-type ribon-helix-helix transcriptional regulator